MKNELTFENVTIPVQDQLRVSTLNLLNNPEMLDDRVMYLSDRLLVTLPDILCLQEVIFESDVDSLALKKIEASTGLNQVIALQEHEDKRGTLSGLAIMSTMETVETDKFYLGVESTTIPYGLYAVLEHGNNVVISINVHLCWGGDKEPLRLQQLMAVNEMAVKLQAKYADQNPIIILSGDFNADPDADSVRYLKGKGIDPHGNATFWTDAWATCGNADNEYTMIPSNYWAKKTALAHDILMPSLMPHRRIDYVFSYGWSYGKNGSPLAIIKDYDTLSPYGYPISDHAGLTVDYWAKRN